MRFERRARSRRSLKNSFEHEGANPISGVGHESGSAIRIKLVNGRHQANAALGDQVPERHAVPAVLKRDRDDVAHVGFDERISGLLLSFAGEQSQLVFVFAREFRDSPNLLDVSIEGCG